MAAARPTAIVSLSDRPDYIKALIYSESGNGKTVLAGSSNGLIIGVEDGTVSAKRQGSTADLWPVESWDDLQAAYRWLKNNPDHGYEWVWIDSLTEMRELAMTAILVEAHANNSNRSLEIPALQDHQTVQIRIKNMVNAFNGLPVNVGYTAHIDKPDNFDDPDTEDEELSNPAMPLIPGKKGQLQQYICGTMHLVGYLGVVPESKRPDPEDSEKTITVPERRVLLCKTTKRYFGKDRFDCLDGGRLRNPTIPELEARIKEAMPTAQHDRGGNENPEPTKDKDESDNGSQEQAETAPAQARRRKS